MRATGNLRAACVLVGILCAPLGCSEKSPEPKEKVETIPLKSMFVTFKQKGVTEVDNAGNKALVHDFSVIMEKMRSGASNVFLVRGKDIATAGAVARQVLAGAGSADIPESVEETPPNSYWLVAYLG